MITRKTKPMLSQRIALDNWSYHVRGLVISFTSVMVTLYGMLSRSTTRMVSFKSLYLYSMLLSFIYKVSVRIGVLRYLPDESVTGSVPK